MSRKKGLVREKENSMMRRKDGGMPIASPRFETASIDRGEEPKVPREANGEGLGG